VEEQQQVAKIFETADHAEMTTTAKIKVQ